MESLAVPILIGMPHLSLGGLSENWLLKECGHRHWMLLASAMGLSSPDFKDSTGRKLYAAFTAVSLTSAALNDIFENDKVSIRSNLQRVSRTQFQSRHAIVNNGITKAVVDLLSVFVHRAVQNSNRSVERRALGGDAGLESVNRSELSDNARKLRGSSDWSFNGFSAGGRSISAEFPFTPCPRSDFNGADFLYFASFQEIVDRAEWEWCRPSSIVSRTSARHLFFYGNIDVGESITVRRCADWDEPTNYTFWCEIVREDGQRIADVFTQRSTA